MSPQMCSWMKRASRCLSFVLFVAAASVAVPSVRAAGVWSDCVPVLTGSFANRIHVKCAASVAGGIRWFAVDTTKADFASRFMSLVNTALVSGKTLSVYYDPADTSGTAFGCDAADCRKVIGINMR